MRDLLVVGGGPAGVVTALYARRAGLSVTLVEPRRSPIDKACGEGLMPTAVAALGRLGVEVPGRPFRGIRYCAGSTVATADFRGGPGRGVRRTELHERLWQALEASGAEIVAGRITDIAPASGSIVAAGIRARYLVGADGLHSQVRRLVGLDPGEPRRRRWGQRAHFAVPPWSEHVEVYWSPRGEAYVTPVGPSCVGVAVLSEHRGRLDEQLAGFAELKARLPDSPMAGVRAAGPLRQAVRARRSGRVLLVGDAAGYVDALTGEGLSISFRSAQALVGRVVADDPAGYESDFRRITRRYRWLTGALVNGTRPQSVRRRVVPVAAAAPWLFALAVDQLAR